MYSWDEGCLDPNFENGHDDDVIRDHRPDERLNVEIIVKEASVVCRVACPSCHPPHQSSVIDAWKNICTGRQDQYLFATAETRTNYLRQNRRRYLDSSDGWSDGMKHVGMSSIHRQLEGLPAFGYVMPSV